MIKSTESASYYRKWNKNYEYNEHLFQNNPNLGQGEARLLKYKTKNVFYIGEAWRKKSIAFYWH